MPALTCDGYQPRVVIASKRDGAEMIGRGSRHMPMHMRCEGSKGGKEKEKETSKKQSIEG